MAREQRCLGVDIRSSGIRACHLQSRRGLLYLDKFGSITLPDSAVTDGAIQDIDTVADALKEVLAANNIQQKRTAFSVSGNRVIIKKISIPTMSQSELENSIRWEAEQFIPFDLNEIYLTASFLDKNRTPGSQTNVALVAAKKEVVDSYQEVLRKCGLEPMICDVDAFSLETMFLENYDLRPGQKVALVQINRDRTTLNILNDGISDFTRDITIGFSAFINNLKTQLGITSEQALQTFQAACSNEAQTSAQLPPNVKKVLQSSVDSIATELQRSIDFYTNTNSENQPGQIFLMGYPSKLDILQKKIHTQLGSEVAIVNPFRRIITDDHDETLLTQEAPGAAISVGLALRYPGDC